ncbi:hypothetical protein HELRODRAFT_112873, partial [Helobdella robusta]|uniref:Alanine--tRNA ligase n=1 Tax=Helobdella robusta TaxID=6412 RepID=T1EFM7_HELRO
MFVEYFKSSDHLFVPSSSVIPKKNDGSYFVNSGMNQFKPIFLGTVDQSSEMASYKRVVNYQKCIRVGGKHNDLEDVGHDYYHHTFFEMLGNWSFNDYSKAEACRMAWDLLTNVYEIPASRLYITYFVGSEKLGLKADEECKDIWIQLGVPKERILPFGMKDNFWVMGEVGPCGPCSEIHYYHGGGSADKARDFVNRGVEDMKEIWNLVFMQYDRQPDGSLMNLPATHIDTGMGLERLTALLQSKSSNYDTDLFRGIFNHISSLANVDKYGGSLVSKTDVAYRVVADHVRMATICIADGLMPGRKDSELLRQVIYRCLYQAQEVLKMPQHTIHSLVAIVVQSLKVSYPYLEENTKQIEEVIRETEHRYLCNITTGRKIMKKALNSQSCSENHKLSEGYFGSAVSYDIISLLAHEFNVSLDHDDYERCLSNINKAKPLAVSPLQPAPFQRPISLTQQDVMRLKEMNIASTDDSHKYVYTVDQQRDYGSIIVNFFILILRSCGIVLDRTCLYATSGGQQADLGHIVIVINEVVDVMNCAGYILHCFEGVSGTIRVGDHVDVCCSKVRLTNSSSNHTSTHILNFALRQVLGGPIKQQGSMVKDQFLTFDFSSVKATITLDDLREVSRTANEIVKKDMKIYRQVVPLDMVQNLPFVIKLDDDSYPKMVNVVSIGSPLDKILHLSSSSLYQLPPCSIELCAGTHVGRTGDIGNIVITNYEGSIQGSKRITAVTRDAANKALQNVDDARNKLLLISSSEDISKKLMILKDLDKSLSAGLLLPKIERENILEDLKNLNFELSQHKNKLSTFHIKQGLLERISKSKNECVICTYPISRTREVSNSSIFS